MSESEVEIHELESRLDSFDPDIRQDSLQSLIGLVNRGIISTQPEKEIANLHCHSFFSYNGYGYSPTHLAWLGKKNGIKFMGVVDFDVLDAVDEFLDACEIAGVRGTAGIETRVCIPEFSDYEINSPGEPGICYHMGTGFTTSVVPQEVEPVLKSLRHRATERNQDMLARINAFLATLHIDYEKDVLPLTPSGNATERHLVHVLAEKASITQQDPAAFWAEKLNLDLGAVMKIMVDDNKFKDLLRSTLMKRGGVGYVQPTGASFPTVEEFHRIMQASGALPCSAWLDGSSQGEQRIEVLLELLISKGVTAINIVPERNWNFQDAAQKREKLNNLYHVVEVARKLDLPILVGTEMNKFGQKMVDDFNAPELDPLKEDFLKGAYIIYGHTQLQRYWGMGYESPWADAHFSSRAAKNTFYHTIGRLIKPGIKKRSNALSAYEPDAVIAYFN